MNKSKFQNDHPKARIIKIYGKPYLVQVERIIAKRRGFNLRISEVDTRDTTITCLDFYPKTIKGKAFDFAGSNKNYAIISNLLNKARLSYYQVDDSFFDCLSQHPKAAYKLMKFHVTQEPALEKLISHWAAYRYKITDKLTTDQAWIKLQQIQRVTEGYHHYEHNSVETEALKQLIPFLDPSQLENECRNKLITNRILARLNQQHDESSYFQFKHYANLGLKIESSIWVNLSSLSAEPCSPGDQMLLHAAYLYDQYADKKYSGKNNVFEKKFVKALIYEAQKYPSPYDHLKIIKLASFFGGSHIYHYHKHKIETGSYFNGTKHGDYYAMLLSMNIQLPEKVVNRMKSEVMKSANLPNNSGHNLTNPNWLPVYQYFIKNDLPIRDWIITEIKRRLKTPGQFADYHFWKVSSQLLSLLPEKDAIEIINLYSKATEGTYKEDFIRRKQLDYNLPIKVREQLYKNYLSAILRLSNINVKESNLRNLVTEGDSHYVPPANIKLNPCLEAFSKMEKPYYRKLILPILGNFSLPKHIKILARLTRDKDQVVRQTARKIRAHFDHLRSSSYQELMKGEKSLEFLFDLSL